MNNHRHRLLSRPPPLATLGLNHLLVSVYLLFTVLLVHGLYMNGINNGKSYLAADKPNASFMDMTIHELAML